VDIGGVSPAFFEASPTAQYDSWLTVGATDGLSSSELGSTGIDFSAWANGPLRSSNGAVFWLNPDDGPSGAEIAIAQITVVAGTSFAASVNLQGRGEDRSVDPETGVASGDWAETGVTFSMSCKTIGTCDVDVDECTSSPCTNGAECIDSATAPASSPVDFYAYRCACMPGWANGACAYEYISQYAQNCTVFESDRGMSGNCDIDVDECSSSPCVNGATCSESTTDADSVPTGAYSCSCVDGYANGVCNYTNIVEQYVAECDVKYSTQSDTFSGNCNMDVDECASRACLHNSTCHDYISDYSCDCLEIENPRTGAREAYKGEHCENEIDVCVAGDDDCDTLYASCQHTGPGLHDCICLVGWEGDGHTCSDIDECLSEPCQNGGVCTQSACSPSNQLVPVVCDAEDNGRPPVDQYRCECAAGYANGLCVAGWDAIAPKYTSQYATECAVDLGGRCDIDINECVSNPCANGAACSDSSDGLTWSGDTEIPADAFSCACIVGFSNGLCTYEYTDVYRDECTVELGGTCDLDADMCASSPCANGGRCVSTFQSYRCECSPGFANGKCNYDLGLLAVRYSVACQVLDSTRDEFSGNCDIDVDECLSNPCANGATCSESSVQPEVGFWVYSCGCLAGFSNGACNSYDFISEYEDECTIMESSASSSTGAGNCNIDVNECASLPCANGGGCVDSIAPQNGMFPTDIAVNEYQCNCLAGFANGDVGLCPEGNGTISGGYTIVAPAVTAVAAGALADFTTFLLTVSLKDVNNVYAVYGTEEDPLQMPVAYQEDAPFGADIGGVSPTFFEFTPTAQYDSWLTVGVTDGLSSSELGSTGIDFSAWANGPLRSSNGAVFWLNPDSGPRGADIAIAQVTVVAGTSFVASVNLQGRGEDRSVDPETGLASGDWAETGVVFTVGYGVGQLGCGSGCDVDIDECESQPCNNGGQCSESSTALVAPDEYACECKGGWAGENCAEDVDECGSEPCVNSVSCSDSEDSYDCACETGWTGDNCAEDVPDCASGPCRHGGTCTDVGIDAYRCACVAGFTSPVSSTGDVCQQSGNCEINVNECASNPCANGGRCSDRADAYICDCKPGWTGDTCAEDVPDCASGPCKHGALCFEGAGYQNVVAATTQTASSMDGFSTYVLTVSLGNGAANLHSLFGTPSYPIVLPAAWQAPIGVNIGGVPASFMDVVPTAEYDSWLTVGVTDGNMGAELASTGVDFSGWSTGGLLLDRGAIFWNDPNAGPTGRSSSSSSGTAGAEIVVAQVTLAAEMLLAASLNMRGKTPSGGDWEELGVSFGAATWEVNVYVCECRAGYVGDNCDMDVDECASGPCKNGACVAAQGSYSCSCDAGWYGENCADDVDECVSQPCKNGGACMESSADEYRCGCVDGWDGDSCLHDVDECQSSPCMNSAECTAVELGEYQCACLTGFESGNCEIDINECSSNPCKNGALCVDSFDSCDVPYDGYSCKCSNGWLGGNCETDVDECASLPCATASTCTENIGSYTCDCKNGWKGDNCERDVDECASRPCANDGRCDETSIDTYECTCAKGWQGKNCEARVAECASRPCANGGACLESVADAYRCTCLVGFGGENCAVDIDECGSNPCDNGAECTESNSSPTNSNAFSCTCARGFAGGVCTTAVKAYADLCLIKEGGRCREDVNECASGPCLNSGRCTESGIDDYFCLCQAGWRGDRCDSDVDECASDPCANGGVCTQDGLDAYACVCAGGWAGVDCDDDLDECNSAPCQNGGTSGSFPRGSFPPGSFPRGSFSGPSGPLYAKTSSVSAVGSHALPRHRESSGGNF
jgi:hypothetical protein